MVVLVRLELFNVIFDITLLRRQTNSWCKEWKDALLPLNSVRFFVLPVDALLPLDKVFLFYFI
ncbi:hypothetical protein ACSBR1_030401 [Camellia fascicularis]